MNLFYKETKDQKKKKKYLGGAGWGGGLVGEGGRAGLE